MAANEAAMSPPSPSLTLVDQKAGDRSILVAHARDVFITQLYHHPGLLFAVLLFAVLGFAIMFALALAAAKVEPMQYFVSAVCAVTRPSSSGTSISIGPPAPMAMATPAMAPTPTATPTRSVQAITAVVARGVASNGAPADALAQIDTPTQPPPTSTPTPTQPPPTSTPTQPPPTSTPTQPPPTSMPTQPAPTSTPTQGSVAEGAWAGSTEQGEPISFRVVRDNIGYAAVDLSVSFRFEPTCPIGTVRFASNDAAHIFGPPAPSFMFLSLRDPSATGSLEGGLGEATASGTLRVVDTRGVEDRARSRCAFSTTVRWTAAQQ